LNLSANELYEHDPEEEAEMRKNLMQTLITKNLVPIFIEAYNSAFQQYGDSIARITLKNEIADVQAGVMKVILHKTVDQSRLLVLIDSLDPIPLTFGQDVWSDQNRVCSLGAKDNSNNDVYFSIYIDPDTEYPEIIHVAIEYCPHPLDSLILQRDMDEYIGYFEDAIKHCWEEQYYITKQASCDEAETLLRKVCTIRSIEVLIDDSLQMEVSVQKDNHTIQFLVTVQTKLMTETLNVVRTRTFDKVILSILLKPKKRKYTRDDKGPPEPPSKKKCVISAKNTFILDAF
jgi:hypothetical protein